MPEGQLLEFSGATKRFGAVTAVSDFTARVEPGVVTGFLGPNGAGKTTSLRMLLGLVRPTAGTVTIDGVRYAKLKHPLQTVGAVLEASSFHPGRTGAGHLTVYANAARIPTSRVDEVLGLVGLADAAGRKVGGYSLGMRQRLGLAYALLGDPGVLVLDEPTNGLDPEGIRWIRGFLRQLAREGRTVLVSSHLLTEVQQTVDALLIISAGRLVFQGGLDELSDPAEQATIVDSADRAALADALRAAGIPFEVLRSGLTVRGIEPVSVGLAAAAAGVPLSSLHKRGPALEEVFLDLVNGTRVHASASGTLPDDVIPAIESGAIPLVETADEGPDAAPEAADDVDESAIETEAPVDEVESDELPEAAPADVESVAEELDAAGMGAAPAAAMSAAAGMAWAHADEDETDDEAAEAGEAVEAEADEPDEAATPHEPSTRTASFAVASTGVIDVITVEDPDAAPAEPEEAAESEPARADDEPESSEDDEAEEAEEAEPAEADETGPLEDDGPTDDAADEERPDDADRAWDEYVRTDADEQADRFFAAFDAEGEPGASESAEVAASDVLDDQEESPPPSDEGEHHDHDGGEHR
ncbi:ABC transporter ATP-binding protein [Microbacterium sp. SSM24]|uniref:ABC transporter ATP-binding protein n=1 Tax=Microbacterium sp. SSM24 TaxID=2991714 RepID=UPI00222734A8|nr:ABC transporter ATP-binding protein [Microbacterium sp. SSM24]MCW3493174.1 ABC transporter ATP-binding protein [Microbacterium sp. SSM24]